MAQITYDDKVDLNTTQVADINKVKASDMNEIKEVVNNNYNEQKTELDSLIKITEMGYVATSQMTPVSSIGGTTGREYNLTFSETYNNPPMVILTVYHNVSISEYGLVTIAVHNITTTGCKLLFGANVGLANYGINYVVISND